MEPFDRRRISDRHWSTLDFSHSPLSIRINNLQFVTWEHIIIILNMKPNTLWTKTFLHYVSLSYLSGVRSFSFFLLPFLPFLPFFARLFFFRWTRSLSIAIFKFLNSSRSNSSTCLCMENYVSKTNKYHISINRASCLCLWDI